MHNYRNRVLLGLLTIPIMFHFAHFSPTIGDDLLEFHQAVVSTLRDADDAPIILDPAPLPLSHHQHVQHTSEDLARISEAHTDVGQEFDDEADTGRSVPPRPDVISVICVCLISSSELLCVREGSYGCLIIVRCIYGCCKWWCT